MTGTLSTTNDRTHKITIDGTTYTVDLALCDDRYDAQNAAQNAFDAKYKAPDRPKKPEFADTTPPQVARTANGAAFVQVVGGKATSSSVNPSACRLSLVFGRDGHVVQTTLDEQQLRLLQREIARVIGEMTVASQQFDAYNTALAAFEDAHSTRDTQRRALRQAAEKLWRENYATDDDEDDDVF